MKQKQVEPSQTVEAEAISAGHGGVMATESGSMIENEQTGESSWLEEGASTARSELTRYAQRNKRLTGVTAFGLITFTLFFTVLLQLLIRKHGDSPAFWSSQFPVLILCNMSLLIGSAGSLLWAASRRQRAVGWCANALADHPDKRSIPALMDLLKFNNLAFHRKAKKALTAILPTLTAGDGNLLSKPHRDALNWILGSPAEQLGNKDIREFFTNTTEREEKFRLAILQAYRQVGDEQALPTVNRVAETEPKSAAGERIRAAAIECLPHLKIQVGKQSAHRSLLRGSAASVGAPEDLLRPTSPRPGSSPEKLLRPSESG